MFPFEVVAQETEYLTQYSDFFIYEILESLRMRDFYMVTREKAEHDDEVEDHETIEPVDISERIWENGSTAKSFQRTRKCFSTRSGQPVRRKNIVSVKFMQDGTTYLYVHGKTGDLNIFEITEAEQVDTILGCLKME